MHKYCLLIGFLFFTSLIYGQRQSDKLEIFNAIEFMSFLDGVSKSEGKLLSRGFEYDGIEVVDKDFSYLRYRIDHSLNSETRLYEFDTFYITNDGPHLIYLSSSGANFSRYCHLLEGIGFRKSNNNENVFIKLQGEKRYISKITRFLASDGTPNYKIYLYSSTQ